MFEVIETGILGLKLIQPRVIGDNRGYFFESFNEREFEKLGIRLRFVQDNQSLSKFGTLRGMHYQRGEYAQTKLVRVLRGKILDAVLDLRPGSHTFQKGFAVELSDDNKQQLLVPKGFAHGFVVLSEEAVVAYKCDVYYNVEAEGGVHALDPVIPIDWRLKPDQILLSDKDKRWPNLEKVIQLRDWERH